MLFQYVAWNLLRIFDCLFLSNPDLHPRRIKEVLMKYVGDGLSLPQLFAVNFSPTIQVMKRGELSEELGLNENSIKYNGTKATIETRKFKDGQRSYFLTPAVKPVPKKKSELNRVTDSGRDENALVFVITLIEPHHLQPQQFNERGWVLDSDNPQRPTTYAECLKRDDFRVKMNFLSSYVYSRMMVNVNNGDSTPSIVDLLSSEDKSNGFTFELPSGDALSWNRPAFGGTVEELCRSREALLIEQAERMRGEAVSKS